MDLVTIATVRAFRGWSADATQDAVLGTLITSISARFEKDLCGRLVEETSRTVQVNISTDQRTVQLPAFPVETLTAVKNSAERDFTGDAVSSDDYYLEAAIGVINFETGLERGAGALQVEYTGGMGTSATDVESTFPDVADAVMRQVVYEYERRNTLGQTSQILAQNSTQRNWPSAGGWLPEVQGVIDKHKLVVFG